MIEAAVIALRLVQYIGAAILGGSSLFFVYAAPGRWPRRLLVVTAALLMVASLAAIPLQASLLAGSFSDGLTREAMNAVLTDVPLGKAALVRAAVSGAALIVLLALPRSRAPVVALGLVAAATLAWMGHSGAAQSALPIISDLLHVLAAAAWLGALAGLVLLTTGARRTGEVDRLRAALQRFSAIGVPLVAVLALSGLGNGWYTVGLAHLAELPASPYGRLLLTKLALFAGMLGLAALNRYRVTARLNPTTLTQARLSVAIEAALGFGVLALVAWFGTMEPPQALG